MNRYKTISINGESYHSGNLDSFLIKYQEEQDKDWINQVYEFLQEWFSESPDIVLKTSGSTGDPKKIWVKKDAMVHSAKATQLYFGLKASDKAVLCLPASYIAGKMMLVRALICGFDIQLIKPSANPFLSIHNGIDFMAVSPYQLTHSLQTVKRKKIKKIIVGGSPVPARLESDLQSVATNFYETYGMTETVSHIALRKLNGEDKSDYFQILPGIEIKLDERNCLVIKAPGLFHGELVTNDIVELKDNISFRWLGRFDNVINSGGIKLFPEQIERKIEKIVTGKYAITSLPDMHLGEKVVLVIEGFPPMDDKLNELQREIAKLLDKYETPKEIRFIPVFPVTGSNKIMRRNLLRM